MINNGPCAFIVDPAFDVNSYTGHYRSYDEGLGNALINRGFGVTILGKFIENESFRILESGIKVFPTLQFDIWENRIIQETRDTEDPEENLLLQLNKMKGTADRAKTLFIFPNATNFQIIAAIDFASRLTGADSVVIILRYHIEIYNFDLINENLKNNGHLLESGRLIFATDSEILKSQYGQIAKLGEIVVLPVPNKVPRISDVKKSASSEIVISSMGNARGEKGFLDILQAINLINVNLRPLNIKFLVHAMFPSNDVTQNLDQFKENLPANVILIEEELTDEKYLEHLRQTDILLAPYSPQIYKGRTSGVLIEAINCGIPAVVSRNSWLQEISGNYGVGNLCSFGDSNSLYTAILEMIQNYEIYSAKAFGGAVISREWNNYENLAHIISKEWQSRHKAKALVFYPWGANEIHTSGSGSRLKLFVEYLLDKNYDVSIYTEGPQQTEIATLQTKSLYLKLGKNKNFHLALHTAELSAGQFELLESDLKTSAVVIFEGSHLVLPIMQKVEDSIKSKVIIISHDLLRSENPDLDKQLIGVQIEALSKGRAYSVSKKEADYFGSRGIKCDVSLSPFEKNSALEEEIVEILLKDANYFLPTDKVILFVGSNYSPNLEAFEFLKKVAKTIESSSENVKFVIVGSVATPSRVGNILSLGRISGLLLSQMYLRCDLVVAPIFSGQGSPSKTIEALANRCRVLATKLGARGLLQENCPTLTISTSSIADTDGFSREINKILTEPKLTPDFWELCDTYSPHETFSHLIENQMTFGQIQSVSDLEKLLIKVIEDQEYETKSIVNTEFLNLLDSKARTLREQILIAYTRSIVDIEFDLREWFYRKKIGESRALKSFIRNIVTELPQRIGVDFQDKLFNFIQAGDNNFSNHHITPQVSDFVFLGDLIVVVKARLDKKRLRMRNFQFQGRRTLLVVYANFIIQKLKRYLLKKKYLRLYPKFLWRLLIKFLSRKR